MDVSLLRIRARSLFIACLIAFSLLSCGNRYDLSTEKGRRARIDDANYHLSKGNCTAATEAIGPLYNSPFVDDEIRIVMASSYACSAHFSFLGFASSIPGASNYFQAFAKTMSNSPNDGAIDYLYQAVDVLTRNGTAMDAGVRSSELNAFMVFLQFGVLGAIERNYGAPGTDGSQGTDLIYEAAGADPANEMSNEDACAVGAAFSHISNSYANSGLSDDSSSSAVEVFDSICVSAGLSSCAQINRYRDQCGGTDANSVTAASVVASVNSGW